MSIEIFINLVQILQMDANEMLGVNLPVLGNEEKSPEMAARLQSLKQNEHFVVLKTNA